jgi:hypothetical protein
MRMIRTAKEENKVTGLATSMLPRIVSTSQFTITCNDNSVKLQTPPRECD